MNTHEIEASRVARFADLKPFSLAFVDSLLPGGRKQNLKVIGTGMAEDPAMRSPIAENHGFTLSYLKLPPGGGAHMHSHRTQEVFVPINGDLHIQVGEGAEEIRLGPLDVISVPVDVMRTFRNRNDFELTLLAVVAGDTGGGGVAWHSDVLDRAARETGLALDDAGKLKRLPNFRAPSDVEGSVFEGQS